MVVLEIRSSAREGEETSSCWEAGVLSSCYILLLGVGVVVPNNLLLDKGVEGCGYLRMTAGAVAAEEEDGNRGRPWYRPATGHC